MKKISTLKRITLLFLTLIAAISLNAQTTSLDLQFNDAADGDRFNFIVDDGGEVTKTVVSGEMKLELNKREWHFFQVWVDPFDFINNPYVSFSIKADQPTPLRMWIKQADGAELTIYDNTIAQSDQYQTIAFTINNLAPLTTNIQEIGIDIGGYQTPPNTFSGTVYFDEFKFGEAAKPSSSLNLDFSEASHGDRFNFIVDDGGEVIKTVSNGEMKLELNKREWHFFQVWISPFDLIKSPYFSFRIKADQPTPLRVWVNQQGGTAEKELYNQTIPAGSEYQTIQIRIDNVAPLTGYLQELSFDIGGYQIPPNTFTGTVYFDEVKLGEAARPATEKYGTVYHEDFSLPLYAGWIPGEGYQLTQENNALKFTVNRSTPIPDAQIGKLPSLQFEGKVLDASENPFLNLTIKGNDPFTLSVIPVDNSNQKKEHKIRVTPTNGYQQISLDLSSIPGIDLSSVQTIYFDFNRDGFAFVSSVLIDEIAIGEGASNKPVMDGIGDKAYYRNSGAKEILLTNIKNASSITVTANDLIENVSVSDITDGTATLKFNIKNNASGEEPVTLQLNGNTGYSTSISSFNLKIENNIPPTLDTIAAAEAKANSIIKIPLTGITDGNATAEQSLRFNVTASNKNIAQGKVIYKEGNNAVLQLSAKKKGTATVYVTLKDNGGGADSIRRSFTLNVYQSLNGTPTIDPVNDLEAYQDAGPSTLALTGISDGDRNRQQVTVTAENSNPAIINNVSVAYTSGSKATLHYTPVADTTGTSTVTITVKDKGGNNSNEGDDSTVISFDISVLKRPVTGYVSKLQKSIEGFNGNDKYQITEVDSGSFKALVFKCTDKFYWDGVTMDLPEELDLSKHPYLTMEIYPVGQNTIHWMWFYDANGNRNDLNNIDYAQQAIAGQWNKVVFNFSGPNDWLNTTANTPINNKRIARVLFDMHNAYFSWPPPPNYTGTFIVRNIRIGSEADFAVTPAVTINQLAAQVAFTNRKKEKVTLAGISNGAGSTSGTIIQITNSNPALISNLRVSSVSSTGKATLTYNTGADTGRATITVTASANGATTKQMSFDINVMSPSAANAAVVTLNTAQRFQKMYGFGTFSIGAANISAYTDSMGGTAMRVGLIGNQFEPKNDNDDPNVLNMEGFDYSAFDWASLKELKARGVKHFILTSWSPPAWMKTNLSIDNYTAGYTLNTNGTTNRLDYTMYEEFAESMVAVVTAFRQRAGIDLLAIGLQNEPAFHEPYPSAILGPNEFVRLLKVVGRRFKKEGIKTRLYLPEHVSEFVSDINQYLLAVKADPEADQYMDILAIHGYGSDGIEPGQPEFEEWEAYRDSSATGNNPKEVWMTETHKDYATFDDALSIAGAIYGALNYGNVSLWTQWAFEGPFVQQGSPTSMLYTMSNFAKFIRPGDIRISATSLHPDILVTSSIDPKTGRTAVVLINKGTEPLSVKLQGPGVGNLWLMYNTAEHRDLELVNDYKNNVFLLPAKSVTSLVGWSNIWKKPSANNSVVADEDKMDSMREVAGLRLYPNPSEGLINIEGNTIREMEIVDVSGKIVHRANLKPGRNSFNLNLAHGVYMARIYSKEGISVRKVVITK